VELRRYYLMARRWAWMIALAAVIAAGAAYIVSSRQPKLYRATSTLIINQAQTSSRPGFTDVSASQQIAKTYAAVATSWPVLSSAAKSLGLGNNVVSSRCPCLVADGKTNSEIGTALKLAEKTVKNYISRIFSKLNITARSQAAVYAIRTGMV